MITPKSSDCMTIIGCGHIGSTSAYALMLRGVACGFVLLDNNRAASEVQVLNHDPLAAAPYPVGVTGVFVVSRRETNMSLVR